MSTYRINHPFAQYRGGLFRISSALTSIPSLQVKGKKKKVELKNSKLAHSRQFFPALMWKEFGWVDGSAFPMYKWSYIGLKWTRNATWTVRICIIYSQSCCCLFYLNFVIHTNKKNVIVHACVKSEYKFMQDEYQICELTVSSLCFKSTVKCIRTVHVSIYLHLLNYLLPLPLKCDSF